MVLGELLCCGLKNPYQQYVYKWNKFRVVRHYVWSSSSFWFRPSTVWIDINDIGSASSKLSFTLAVDDTDIFKKDTVVNQNN